MPEQVNQPPQQEISPDQALLMLMEDLDRARDKAKILYRTIIKVIQENEALKSTVGAKPIPIEPA